MPRKRRTIPWLEIRDKTYYVFWTDDATGKTKRISLRTADSLEAQHRYAAFLAKGHEIFNPAPNSITVSQALTVQDGARRSKRDRSHPRRHVPQTSQAVLQRHAAV